MRNCTITTLAFLIKREQVGTGREMNNNNHHHHNKVIMKVIICIRIQRHKWDGCVPKIIRAIESRQCLRSKTSSTSSYRHLKTQTHNRITVRNILLHRFDSKSESERKRYRNRWIITLDQSTQSEYFVKCIMKMHCALDIRSLHVRAETGGMQENGFNQKLTSSLKQIRVEVDISWILERPQRQQVQHFV